jgi:hypothetical protein
MTEEWKKELEFTSKIVKEKVFPVLKGWGLGGRGRVEDVEGQKFEHRIIKILDNFAGIDAIEVNPDKGIRGISIRCQWITNKVFNSFSIRYERSNGARTEFDKRTFQMISREGWLYPALTIQAYFQKIDGVKSNHLLTVGMAYTRDIYEAIVDNGQAYITQDKNKYLSIGWEKMRELGYHVKSYP